MLLRSLKTFLKSLKFYFTPLGVMSIFYVIGIFVFINMTTNAIMTLFKDVSVIVGNTSLTFDWGAIFDKIVGSVRALDWKDFMKALSTMTSQKWISDTLYAALGDVFGSLEEFANQVMEAIGNTFSRIAMGAVFALILNLVGIVVGYIVTAFFTRIDLTKTTLPRALLMILIDFVILVITFGLVFLAGTLWAPLSVIVFLLGLIGLEVFSVMEAYWLHGRGKTTLKELLKISKIAMLMLGDLIIVVIGAILFALLFFVGNPLLAIYLGLPLAELTSVVLQLTGETYVLESIGYDKAEWKQEKREKKALKKEEKKLLKDNKEEELPPQEENKD